MSDIPLQGKKVAILVETEYVPAEINYYLDLFPKLGAEVHLLSNLWYLKDDEVKYIVSDVDDFVSEKPTFEENLEATRKKLEVLKLDASNDLNRRKPEEYAAVIMAANYTSVRLRWPPDGTPATADMARAALAVRFFARAMRNPTIVKGALCHGLWILTPMPELLAGHRVICNKVVVADVTNAGGIYVPPLNQDQPFTAAQPAHGVVVDGDLVTGEGWKDTPDFVAAIADEIVRLEQKPAVPSPPLSEPKPSHKLRTILVILSERGFWGEELVGPLEVFDNRGYTLRFATPRGRRPRALPPSWDPNYVDPPLGRPVVSEEMARKVLAINESPRLANPIDLSAWLPERPYWSAPTFVRGMESYNFALARVYEDLRREYDAMLIVGGSGPVVDLVNNQRVHDLILGFYKLGRPIGAECYGVPCLAFARDTSDRKSLLWGKHVTGHCLEYDYKDGTGFLGDDVKTFNMGPPPYPLEYILRDATGPDGAYHGNFGRPTSVIVDYPFITGRSTPDAYLTGQKMVEVLEDGLRQWGWKASVYTTPATSGSRSV